jgi:nucleoside-diphosphate-sugar epimerase
MRVAVTGGSGFIGRPAVEQLARMGAEIHLLDRSRHVDLLTDSCLAERLGAIRPTHLLHLAWETEPPGFWHSPRNADWVAASQRLVEAFATAGGRRMVVAGSCAEYLWGDAALDERTTPLAPATPYGRAKADLFERLETLAPALGLSFAWGRIFFPFGPGEKAGRLLPDTIAALRDRRPIDLSDGAQILDLLFVDDVAAAFAALLASGVEGPVNIASGTGRSVRSVVEAFADRTGGRALLRFGARPRRAWEAPSVVAAVERLRKEVGFIPRFGWDEAIDLTLAWWLPQCSSR